jgi:hypothetical protein
MNKITHWKSDTGMLIRTTGNINVANATKISKHMYYKLRKKVNKLLEHEF